MPADELIPQVAVLLSYLMVVMALLISASSTLTQMVWLYRAQAWLLTVVVLLTSLEEGRVRAAVAALALLPVALAVLVPPLLGRASVTRIRPGRPAGRGPAQELLARGSSLRNSLRDQPASAELVWLQHGRSRLRGGQAAAVDMLLIAAAVLVAYRLIRGDGGADAGEVELGGVVPSLAVTIALVLQGLFTMSNKRDIIAQVIGLLVIEHGLFLAAVRVAPPSLAFLFVLSLFCYLLITLTILLWILPELHRASGSIEVHDHSRLKG
jgi:hydrogenase-4 membrane subunit HyfE